MKNNFFTIAIPCFKVNNDYFKECIESIYNQDYTNFECFLLVSDDTLDENLIPRDERFKIVKCEQHSTGFKRNTAIKKANGEYIIFVDCDDCIDKKYLSLSNTILCNNDVDIIYYEVTKDNSLINVNEPINFETLTGEEILKLWIEKILCIDDTTAPSWLFSGNPAKVYKTSFLKNNNILLNEDFGLIGEDKIFNFKCATYLPKIAYSNYHSYWWRTNTESFYRKKNSKNSLAWLNSYLKYIDEIFVNQQNYFSFIEKAKYQFIFYWIPKYSRLDNSGKLLKFSETFYLLKSNLKKSSVLRKFYIKSKFKNVYCKNRSHKFIYFWAILFIKIKLLFLLNILLRLYTKFAYKKANKKGK